MNKKELFDSVITMESQIGDLYTRLGNLKKSLSGLLEENNILKIENEHLRTRLHEISQMVGTDEIGKIETTITGSSQNNLAVLYHEGFHICPDYFGSPRMGHECLFCIPFLERKDSKP